MADRSSELSEAELRELIESDRASHEWNKLIDAERLSAASLVSKEATEVSSVEVRAYWSDVERLLRGLFNRSGPPEPLPMDMFARLLMMAGDLRAGRMPTPISGAIDRRRQNAGPAEERLQRVAAAYVLAGWAKKLPDDQNHTKTVADAFGVNVRTVTRWVNKEKSSVNINALTSKAIDVRMREAGQFYRDEKQRQKAATQNRKKAAK